MSIRIASRAGLVLALSAATFAAPSAQAADITVLVNDQPVYFDTVKPAQIAGRVMIPLRKVSEALGAEVRWDASTRSVLGLKGDSEFTLPIGGRTATVNGQPVRLDVPAQIAFGTTMVPLRFVAEALGAEVRWSSALMQVAIETSGEAPPAPPVARTSPTGRGQVLGVLPRSNEVVVRVDGQRKVYRLGPGSSLLRGREGERGLNIDLNDIHVGDEVMVTLDDRSGRIETLQVLAEPAPAPGRPGEITGEVISVRAGNPGSIAVRTNEGRISYDVPRDSILLKPDASGRAFRTTLDQIRVGDRVTISLDSRGEVARTIEVAAEVAAPSTNLRITSFTHNAREALRAGQQVEVELQGTPGAQAFVDAGTIARNVPLREERNRPGTYTGSFVVPAGVTAAGVPLIGQLKMGTQSAPLIQAGQSLNVDSEPPVVRDVAPADGSVQTSSRPDIYAEISDGAGSGIDMASLRMYVAGREVTRDAKITPRFVLYSPAQPLPVGDVPVQIMLRDQAGNQTTSSWKFNLRPQASAIESISHDAQTALRAGEVVTVTAHGPRESRMRFSLGELAKNIAMQEVQPGVYVGRYTVRREDQADRVPVIVELTNSANQIFRQEASAPVLLATRAVVAPKILGPADPVDIDRPLIINGTAQPNARIRVQVDFTGRAFGALPVNGTVGSQEVVADASGAWKTAPFEVRLPLATSRVRLTVQAAEVLASGQQSQPARVELRAK